MPTIPPKFILYKSQRYSNSLRYNRKLELASPQLDYLRKRDHIKFYQKVSSTPRHSLTHINYLMTTKPRENKLFREYISKLSSLKSLHLTLGFGVKENFEEMKRTIKKIFKRCKHLAKLTMSFETMDQINMDLFNHIFLLKSLQHLRLKFHYCQEPTARILQDYLNALKKRERWPVLKSQVLDLNIDPRIQTSLQLNKTYRSFIKAFENAPEKTHFQVALPFFQDPCPRVYVSLAKALKKIPSLSYLEANGVLKVSFFHILTALENSKDLRNISLNLSEKQDLKNLQDILRYLGYIEALKNLVIWMETPADVERLKYFTGGLELLTKIDSLALNFTQAQNLTDEILMNLAKSLRNLGNLKNLSLKLFGRYMGSLDQDSLGVEAIFTAIGELTSLKGLTLEFVGLGQIVSGNLFKKLCKSLEKCTQLETLTIQINSSRLGNQSLTLFAKALGGLKCLESMSLDLGGSYQVSMDVTRKLFHCLGGLKSLGNLVVRLACVKMNESLAIGMNNMLCGLKKLNSVDLRIKTKERDSLADRKIKGIQARFEEKMKINVNIQSC